MIRSLSAALLALFLLSPAATLAADEPRLRDAVTDDAGVLSGDEERAVEDALKDIRDRYDVQLFVAYIDTTLRASVTDFATSTAEANSLGGNDALFLVAFDDRSQSIWVSDALDGITDDEVDAALGVTEGLLADGDFAGAAIAAGEALGAGAVSAAVTAAPGTAAPATEVPGGVGNPEPEPASGGVVNLGAILAFLLIAGGLFIVARTLLARRTMARRPGGFRPPAEGDDLARQANRGLLATDEAVREADQEVGFAEAQWGAAEAAPYREALAKAQEELRAAFSVRQRIDDAVPETPEQRRAMLGEIVTRTTAAGELLAAQATRLAELRDLERTAPEQLAALPAALQALHVRHAAAAAALERLAGTYTAPAVAPVSGNLVEADKALAAAAAEGERGRALPESDRTGRTIALRRAQEAAASATRLVEAVERLATDLDAAAARLPGELAAAAADVATARDGLARTAALPPLAGPSGGTGQGAPGRSDPAAAVADAERLLDDARRAAEARPLDPLDALERATAANRAADAITAGLQVSEAQRQRRLQLAATAVTSARGRVDRAIDYITTRRHGVGRTARTRAAEAEASLADAARLAVTDPEAAVTAAQRAIQLADEAYRLATLEFDGWDSGRGPVAGPYAPPAPPSPGADIAGAIIGGIVGGMLAGGGRRGSGWGGSTWGGPMGGGRRGGGFGMPGPIGGGGGGGGGRARGGRW